MTQKIAWWKLCLFAGVAIVVLFLFPPTNHVALVLWLVAAYGGVAIWLKTNEHSIDNHMPYTRTVFKEPVAEFMDEDRLHLQTQGDEWVDDSLFHDPHELI